MTQETMYNHVRLMGTYLRFLSRTEEINADTTNTELNVKNLYCG